jgi:hypothetical protein
MYPLFRVVLQSRAGHPYDGIADEIRPGGRRKNRRARGRRSVPEQSATEGRGSPWRRLYSDGDAGSVLGDLFDLNRIPRSFGQGLPLVDELLNNHAHHFIDVP